MFVVKNTFLEFQVADDTKCSPVSHRSSRSSPPAFRHYDRDLAATAAAAWPHGLPDGCGESARAPGAPPLGNHESAHMAEDGFLDAKNSAESAVTECWPSEYPHVVGVPPKCGSTPAFSLQRTRQADRDLAATAAASPHDLPDGRGKRARAAGALPLGSRESAAMAEDVCVDANNSAENAVTDSWPSEHAPGSDTKGALCPSNANAASLSVDSSTSVQMSSMCDRSEQGRREAKDGSMARSFVGIPGKSPHPALAEFVAMHLSFLKIQSIMFRQSERSKRWELRISVANLPWTVRKFWLQPLARGICAVLGKAGAVAELKGGTLLMRSNITEGEVVAVIFARAKD